MAFAGSIAPCVPVPQHSKPAASPDPADARTPNELLHGVDQGLEERQHHDGREAGSQHEASEHNPPPQPARDLTQAFCPRLDPYVAGSPQLELPFRSIPRRILGCSPLRRVEPASANCCAYVVLDKSGRLYFRVDRAVNILNQGGYG